MPDASQESAAEARRRRDKEFNDLWRRRDRLSEAEWKRLWEIVSEELSRVGFTHYSSLPGFFREDLIVEFFSSKVFEPVRREEYEPHEEAHTGLPIVMYANFLLDLIAEERREPASPVRGVNDPDAALTRYAESVSVPGDGEHQVLAEMGVTTKEVVESAKVFYCNSPQWVRVYLREHHCPHPEESVPLVRVAAQWEIPNQHQRAAKLGITWPRGGFEVYTDFGSTMLGGWVAGLGIPIASENGGAIRAALEILCLVSLSLGVEPLRAE